ncbi:2-amino-4-hydroxy-6-hydroxymethyldihydropteridine diphosphokinase [Pseudidiomarina marina]|uniref:2-amino-4-hydroxy-6- hydroxymethyldihydropteridine diphosphokinase n=1 Tax=Pseudidiomarina marina TaxID=502366 RepID=UPI00384F0CDF
MHPIYLCSMGANIAPESNFAAAQESISELGKAYYSRAIYTQPVNMCSEHDFLNALFLIVSPLDSIALKKRFNAIEISLGRDRDDPQSSTKDRPMDIDILGELNSEQVWQEVPDYLQEVIPNLKPIADELVQTQGALHD